MSTVHNTFASKVAEEKLCQSTIAMFIALSKTLALVEPVVCRVRRLEWERELPLGEWNYPTLSIFGLLGFVTVGVKILVHRKQLNKPDDAEVTLFKLDSFLWTILGLNASADLSIKVEFLPRWATVGVVAFTLVSGSNLFCLSLKQYVYDK